mmetsp:Transcript_8263/g.20888  ORF Transcript_8263/g.20888 Transcript_8263/m.20888 type:complete len:153 (-) Transcript_8263:58-516(-)
MADAAKLAPLFAKLSEVAMEISLVFGGGNVTLKRSAGDAGVGGIGEDGKPLKKKKEKRAPRAPTAFNLFMKRAVAEVKIETPQLNPKEIFASCAAKWKLSPENPKLQMSLAEGGLAIAVETEKAKKAKEAKALKKEAAKTAAAAAAPPKNKA